jgi:hypothetical protein
MGLDTFPQCCIKCAVLCSPPWLQVEPVASQVPYMTCPGNHEWHYNFSNYRQDPGGTVHAARL